ncbi:zinc finger protein OZF-like isoform X1 [Cheilinus undulatus]|uniref:zinc finger protein OZF-like isoform X1 n=1 Tax=Cheilinus undulatus TaxID=241271 RepID=UPI001BD2E46A|nr:zinc finger protein OZF-like isoform X1 [Cheilinus undulatus]
MSKVQILRSLVNQRLAAAAEEIFELFEKTIAEYEEEIYRSKDDQRKRQDPDQPHSSDFKQLVSEEEVPQKQLESSSSLKQEEPPEPAHIKEEQEELWISQEREFTFFPVAVKSEEDDEEEKPLFSQLHENQADWTREECLKTEADGQDCGGAAARDLISDGQLPSVTHKETSPSSETLTDDSSCEREASEPQEGLNPLQNSKVGVSHIECNNGNIAVSSSECAPSFDQAKQKKKPKQTQKGEKPFGCSVCGKEYYIKNSLKTHMKLHTERKQFSCSFCPKTFPARTEMVTHTRVHTGEKPFGCSICGVRFAQSSNLTSHLRVHTGEKPFSCSVCQTSFSLRNNLALHMRTHTGEKPFSCSVCGKKFTLRGNLRRHSAVHTGEKHYSCSVCGQSFTQHGTLKRHTTVHAREKPYSCSVCNKKFTRQEYVKKHKCVGESSGNPK